LPFFSWPEKCFVSLTGQSLPVTGLKKGTLMSINSISSASNAWSMLSQTQGAGKSKAVASKTSFTLPEAPAAPKKNDETSALQKTVQGLVGLSTGGVSGVGTLLNLFA
jgi:hypothetical protein